MSETYTAALRSQPRILAVALPTLVLLWWWLWGHADQHLQSDSLVAAASLWFLMMVAMMLPPQLPWLALLARQGTGQSSGHAQLLPFLSGYLLVWGLFSAGAAALQLALADADLLLGHDGRLPQPLGAFLLIGIGLFQLTPWKQACLRHCRTPMGFFLSHWRPGVAGALRMGLQHGLYCLGCCWALMLAGFALGVMHLGLMAGLVLLMSLEQLAPHAARWRHLGAALFLFASTAMLLW